MEHERPWKHSSGHAAAAAALQPEADGDSGDIPGMSPGLGARCGRGCGFFPIGEGGLGPAASDSAVPGHKVHQQSPVRAGDGGAVGPHREQ